MFRTHEETTRRKTSRMHRRGTRAICPTIDMLEARMLLSNVTWIGKGDGKSWVNAANWSNDQVPTASDNVTINLAGVPTIQISSGNQVVHSLTDSTASLNITGASLSLGAPSSVSQNVTIAANGVLDASGNLTVGGTLNESGGELGGSGTVTVTGLTTWTGGTMSGPGTTAAAGGLSIGTGGTTHDSEELAGRTLINAGAGVWYGPDNLTQEESSTFLNARAATLKLESGPTSNDDSVAPDDSGTFENQGTLTVGDGSATTVMRAFFINAGSVAVNSGTLQLGDGGQITGSFAVAAGATLVLGNNYNYEVYAFDSSASLSGPGTVNFGSGVSASFAAGSTYNVPVRDRDQHGGQ